MVYQSVNRDKNACVKGQLPAISLCHLCWDAGRHPNKSALKPFPFCPKKGDESPGITGLNIYCFCQTVPMTYDLFHILPSLFTKREIEKVPSVCFGCEFLFPEARDKILDGLKQRFGNVNL